MAGLLHQSDSWFINVLKIERFGTNHSVKIRLRQNFATERRSPLFEKRRESFQNMECIDNILLNLQSKKELNGR